MNVSVQCNSTFYSNANLDYCIDSASLNNSEELHIRNFQPQICVRQWQCLQISKWRISKIGLLECLVVQIQKIPKKLNDRKLKQSLKIAQEISWSVSSRTAGIFGSFV